MSNTWQLQAAKNQFSALVNNALKDGVQIITRHGEPAVVVMAISEYRKLKPKKQRLSEILRACPVKNWDLRRVRDVPRDLAL